MILRAPTVELCEGEARLVARLEPERGGEPRVMRIGVPRERADWLDRTATPFVPVAALLAGAIGEDLRAEAPVSPVLARGVERIGARFAEWWGYRAVRVEAPEAREPESAAEVAALFSGGIDTSATLLRSLRGEIPERATHLISMFGSEFKLPAATQRASWREIEAAAAEYGLPLIRVTTNAPFVTRPELGWPRSHGACFAGLGLALGPRFEAVLVSASQRPSERRPHGSRPDIDPHWSTGATRIVHHGAELGRYERTAIVASSPIALRHLNVCWQDPEPGNCGHCEKCLRTMTFLELCGGLERTDRFRAPLELEAIRDCVATPSSVIHVRELLEHIPAERPELRDAWERALRRGAASERAERRRAARERLARSARRAARRARRLSRRLARRLRRARRQRRSSVPS